MTYLPPDATAPVVEITFPTDQQEATTTEAQVNLSGEADDNRAMTRATWANNRGGSGEATGTRAWHANGIVLQPSVNILTFTAEDAAGNTSTDTLSVTFASTTADPARPVLAVQTPDANPLATESATLACTGQVSGSSPIAEVVVQLNGGPWLGAATPDALVMGLVFDGTAALAVNAWAGDEVPTRHERTAGGQLHTGRGAGRHDGRTARQWDGARDGEEKRRGENRGEAGEWRRCARRLRNHCGWTGADLCGDKRRVVQRTAEVCG